MRYSSSPSRPSGGTRRCAGKVQIRRWVQARGDLELPTSICQPSDHPSAPELQAISATPRVSWFRLPSPSASDPKVLSRLGYWVPSLQRPIYLAQNLSLQSLKTHEANKQRQGNLKVPPPLL